MYFDGFITGWKNIANWLGVCDRTAKTYYYSYSMPVRKFPGQWVCIIPEEVTEWLIVFRI
jgi:hypothetical protein